MRNPIYKERRLDERKGWLRLYTGNFTLDDIQARNIVVQRETEKNYNATAEMDFSPKTVEQAGLICYFDTYTYISFSLRRDAEKHLKLVVEEKRGREMTKGIAGEATGIAEGKPLYLRIEVKDLQRKFLYSYDNRTWTAVATIKSAWYMSDSATPMWGFMGTMVGMYALNYGSGIRIPADFNFFDYNPQ